MYGQNELRGDQKHMVKCRVETVLHALILVKSRCFTDHETLQLGTRIKWYEDTFEGKLWWQMTNFVELSHLIVKEIAWMWGQHGSDGKRHFNFMWMVMGSQQLLEGVTFTLCRNGSPRNLWDPNGSGCTLRGRPRRIQDAQTLERFTWGSAKFSFFFQGTHALVFIGWRIFH